MGIANSTNPGRPSQTVDGGERTRRSDSLAPAPPVIIRRRFIFFHKSDI